MIYFCVPESYRVFFLSQPLNHSIPSSRTRSRDSPASARSLFPTFDLCCLGGMMDWWIDGNIINLCVLLVIQLILYWMKWKDMKYLVSWGVCVVTAGVIMDWLTLITILDAYLQRTASTPRRPTGRETISQNAPDRPMAYILYPLRSESYHRQQHLTVGQD